MKINATTNEGMLPSSGWRTRVRCGISIAPAMAKATKRGTADITPSMSNDATRSHHPEYSRDGVGARSAAGRYTGGGYAGGAGSSPIACPQCWQKRSLGSASAPQLLQAISPNGRPPTGVSMAISVTALHQHPAKFRANSVRDLRSHPPRRSAGQGLLRFAGQLHTAVPGGEFARVGEQLPRPLRLRSRHDAPEGQLRSRDEVRGTQPFVDRHGEVKVRHRPIGSPEQRVQLAQRVGDRTKAENRRDARDPVMPGTQTLVEDLGCRRITELGRDLGPKRHGSEPGDIERQVRLARVLEQRSGPFGMAAFEVR